MSQSLWDTPPSDEIFEEVKSAAIKMWETYDNTYGYVDEKLSRVQPLENVWSNFMYIWNMFDRANQFKLLQMVSVESSDAIIDREMPLPDMPHLANVEPDIICGKMKLANKF